MEKLEIMRNTKAIKVSETLTDIQLMLEDKLELCEVVYNLNTTDWKCSEAHGVSYQNEKQSIEKVIACLEEASDLLFNLSRVKT